VDQKENTMKRKTAPKSSPVVEKDCIFQKGELILYITVQDDPIYAQFEGLVNPTTAKIYWAHEKEGCKCENVSLAFIRKANNINLLSRIHSLKNRAEHWKNKYEERNTNKEFQKGDWIAYTATSDMPQFDKKLRDAYQSYEVYAQFEELVDAATAKVRWTQKETNRYTNIPLASISKATNSQLSHYIDRLILGKELGDYWKNRYEKAAKRLGEDILEIGFQGVMMSTRSSRPPFTTSDNSGFSHSSPG
jgi:hypothetical protein